MNDCFVWTVSTNRRGSSVGVVVVVVVIGPVRGVVIIGDVTVVVVSFELTAQV